MATEPCCCNHLSCRGPTGPFAPSVYFQAAVGASTTPIPAVAATVPLDVVLANVGAAFDVTTHAFVAPLDGPYRFQYTLTLQGSGVGEVQIVTEIGNWLAGDVPHLAAATSLLTTAETGSLAGGAIIDLLQGQTLKLTARNVGGIGTAAILGAQSNLPPYPSLLCVHSLF